MKFSIVVVTLNSSKYLSETLKSIIAQEFEDYEVLLKDGGSTDDTLRIYSEYQSDGRFRSVVQDDTGLAEAMNQGATAARGDYVIFLHSDDRFSSSKSLTFLSKAIESKPNIIWGFGFYSYIDENGLSFRIDDVKSRLSFNSHILRNVVRHQSSFVKRSIFDTLKFDSSYKYAMDYEFFLNLWGCYEPILVREIISDFRVSGTNLSSNFYKSIEDEFNVRKHWRARRGDSVFHGAFDIIIFALRLLKLRFVHGKKPS